MIAKGKIKQISYGISGGFSVVLDMTEATLEELKLLEPEELSIEIKKYRKRRSLNANAYFHTLAGDIAEVLHVSNTYVKNLMVGKYGRPEIIDGKNVYFSTQLEPEYAYEIEDPHLLLTHTDYRKGKTFYSYMVMRKTREYDTKEMARLIDGTIQEAKDLGIETLPPYELERMKQQWKATIV